MLKHLIIALVIASLAGVLVGTFLLGPMSLPELLEWGCVAAVGYFSVYVAERTLLDCKPSGNQTPDQHPPK